MRDLQRMKEKFEVSLDSGQLIGLAVATLVVVGFVFAMGIAVGKKLGATAPVAAAAAPEDPLAALDRKADEDPLAAADASLTFHEELTRKAPSVVVMAPVELAKPAPPKPEPVRAEAVAAVPKPEPLTAEPMAALAPKSEPVSAIEAPKPRLDDAFARAASPAAEPVPTRTRDAGLLKDAIARAQKPAEAAADGAWTLQIAAYQDKAEAERMTTSLRDKGYAPFLVEAQVPSKGLWYRVRMGRFPTKDAAGRYLADFKRETAISAIVTNAN